MKRVNKKTLKDLTTLMLMRFMSSLAFFVVMSALDLITDNRVIRSILSVSLFSADMLFLILFMSCVYGIKALHEEFGTVWKFLFFRIVLIFMAMIINEFSYLSEFEPSRELMRACADITEKASLFCFVMAYWIMTGCFARLLEDVKKEEQAKKCRKGGILYVSIGISAVLFGIASLFVPAEGKTVIMADVLKTIVFVMRLLVILLDIPIYFAVRDAIGNIWRMRLEKAQEGRRIR